MADALGLCFLDKLLIGNRIKSLRSCIVSLVLYRPAPGYNSSRSLPALLFFTQPQRGYTHEYIQENALFNLFSAAGEYKIYICITKKQH
jgi:hypothetical protein